MRARQNWWAMAAVAPLLGGFFGCMGAEPSPDREYHAVSAAGLPTAGRPDTLLPAGGEVVTLTAAPIRKVLGGEDVLMLGYNGSIPGPFLRVKQGTRIILRLRNRLGMPTTLHPHRLRLENRFDGTNDVQRPIADGDSFDYELAFPDPGPFWYHPHLNEAFQLERGLYGGVLVEPADRAYWPPAHREELILLDDFLMDGSRVRKDRTTHAMMGCFGNIFLSNGEEEMLLRARRNEVIRFHLVNAANARVFDLGFHARDADGNWRSHPIRVVGTDLGS